jgi:preprotein translocase subunit SecA
MQRIELDRPKVLTLHEEAAWKAMLEQQITAFRKRMSQAEAKRVQRRPVDPNLLRGIGRNVPCPCGSGKKFKRCCLQYMAVGK